jgi:hypothetical protein
VTPEVPSGITSRRRGTILVALRAPLRPLLHHQHGPAPLLVPLPVDTNGDGRVDVRHRQHMMVIDQTAIERVRTDVVDAGVCVDARAELVDNATEVTITSARPILATPNHKRVNRFISFFFEGEYHVFVGCLLFQGDRKTRSSDNQTTCSSVSLRTCTRKRRRSDTLEGVETTTDTLLDQGVARTFCVKETAGTHRRNQASQANSCCALCSIWLCSAEDAEVPTRVA